ncbi:hypothetical protein NDU88_002888, partial [Pleurodeles waltl]
FLVQFVLILLVNSPGPVPGHSPPQFHREISPQPPVSGVHVCSLDQRSSALFMLTQFQTPHALS